MALSRTAPPRAAVRVWAAVACGTALAGAGLPAFAATAPPAHAAASTLITVTVTGVPALGVNAFQGSYATSTVAQNGGDNSAATMDPDGVLDRFTLDQPAQSKTHSDAAKNWADAQPSVEYSLHGKKLYSISSVDAHAECASSSPMPTTYVHTAAGSVTVLGKSIASGKTTVPVTGAQLGVAGVDHGSLDVTYSTEATSAQAHLELSISGVFYDSAGKQLYSGPVQKLRLGDVQVTCQSSGTPTQTPTPTQGPTSGPSTASSAPMPTTTMTMTATPTPDGRSATTGSAQTTDPGTPADPVAPVPEDGATNPAAVAAHPRHAPHGGKSRKLAKGEPGASTPENGPMVPAANAAATSSSGGSDSSLWWALLSVVALGSGAGLFVVTRRRGRHQ